MLVLLGAAVMGPRALEAATAGTLVVMLASQAGSRSLFFILEQASCGTFVSWRTLKVMTRLLWFGKEG